MKALDIIVTAMEAIGIHAPGEDLTDADAQRALSIMNAMMDGWSNEPQACYAFRKQSLTLVPNKGSYSIGPVATADVVGDRPLKITQCSYTDDYGTVSLLRIVEQYEWNTIGNPLQTGQTPSVLFYEPQMPLAYLHFWTLPEVAGKVVITSYLQLSNFPNLYTDVILPRGYVPALNYNLALELAPFYGKAVVSPVVIEMAARYLANVKRTNQQDMIAVYDAEICGGISGGYDIRSDTFNRGGYN